ncbi:MAG: aldose 1-epimerase family protein [Clostridia bacterium]
MKNFDLHTNVSSGSVCSIGGELIACAVKGRQLLWHGDQAYWEGHAPLLFPIVGRAYGGQLIIDGCSYEMPIHGVVKNRIWSLVSQSSDRMMLRFVADAESLQHYPFAFVIDASYILHVDGFTTRYTVRNSGNRPMPFCIGAHPGFLCPMEPHACLSDYELHFAQNEEGTIYKLRDAAFPERVFHLNELQNGHTLPLTDTLFTRYGSIVFAGTHSRSVALQNRRTGEGLRLDFPDYKTLCLWTIPGSGFLCMEPWSGLPAFIGETGELADKPYVRTLPPGECASYEYTVHVYSPANQSPQN